MRRKWQSNHDEKNGTSSANLSPTTLPGKAKRKTSSSNPIHPAKMKNTRSKDSNVTFKKGELFTHPHYQSLTSEHHFISSFNSFCLLLSVLVVVSVCVCSRIFTPNCICIGCFTPKSKDYYKKRNWGMVRSTIYDASSILYIVLY